MNSREWIECRRRQTKPKKWCQGIFTLDGGTFSQQCSIVRSLKKSEKNYSFDFTLDRSTTAHWHNYLKFSKHLQSVAFPWLSWVWSLAIATLIIKTTEIGKQVTGKKRDKSISFFFDATVTYKPLYFSFNYN